MVESNFSIFTSPFQKWFDMYIYIHVTRISWNSNPHFRNGFILGFLTPQKKGWRLLHLAEGFAAFPYQATRLPGDRRWEISGM